MCTVQYSTELCTVQFSIEYSTVQYSIVCTAYTMCMVYKPLPADVLYILYIYIYIVVVQRVRLYTGVIAARARKKHAGRTMPVFAQFSHGFPPEQGGGGKI